MRAATGIVLLLALLLAAPAAAAEPPDYEALGLGEILVAEYQSGPIHAWNDESNEMPEGAIVFYRTDQERYGKFQLISHGMTLSLRWTTYEAGGEIMSQGSLYLPSQDFVDLDAGLVTGVDTGAADFLWNAVFGQVEWELIPRNGTLRSIYWNLPVAATSWGALKALY